MCFNNGREEWGGVVLGFLNSNAKLPVPCICKVVGNCSYLLKNEAVWWWTYISQPLLCLLNEIIFHLLTCCISESWLYWAVSMNVFYHRSILTEGMPVAVLFPLLPGTCEAPSPRVSWMLVCKTCLFQPEHPSEFLSWESERSILLAEESGHNMKV